MGIAFWLSPKGEIIAVGSSHIHEILRYPVKFGLNSTYIKQLHDFYRETMGTEGTARKLIMINLFDNGWIRLRKYGDKFWAVNVKALTNRSRTYLSKWAQQMLKGIAGFQELDPFVPVKIDQKNKEIVFFNISAIANSDDFRTTGYQRYEVSFRKTEELEDLPLYDFVVEELSKKNLNLN